MRPYSVTSYAMECWDALKQDNLKEKISEAYKKLRKTGNPDISVVIPAYNEEKNILQTLYSITNNTCEKSVEILVVNNNSKDNTESLVLSTGVRCVTEYKQGITAARNCGLRNALGTIQLNADADSIYPKDWIEEMSSPFFSDQKIAVTYGRFSFIPTQKNGRLSYYIYEHIADFKRLLNKLFKDEAVNVYGFNSGFRRLQGIEVDGFNHPPGANEDGWLALKLRDKGFGKLHAVTASKAMVWTSDRRIIADGGLFNATSTRIKRVFFKYDNNRTDL